MLSDLMERYEPYTRDRGVVMIPLYDYSSLCFALGRALTTGPMYGTHGGILFSGNEFLPAGRWSRMKLKLTEHARQRCQEMGVPTKQVKTILDRAEVDAPSGRGDGYRIAVADNLAVPYSLSGYAITVLWRGELDRDAPGQGLRVGPG
jgi:hypothetical protein